MKLTNCLLLAGFLSLSALGSLVEEPQNIRIKDGVIMVSQGDSSVVLEDDFAKPSEIWLQPFKVFEDFTWIHHAETNGRASLRIERNPKRVPPEKRLFDTAWELKSRLLDLPADASYVTLELQVMSNNPEMANAAGFKNSFLNAISWFGDDDTTPVKRDIFSFGVAEKHPADTILEFSVPAGARKMQLSMGADTPDLQPKEFVAFCRARLSLTRNQGRYLPQAEFCTCPRRLDGAVQVEAEVPAGTSLQLLASTGDSDDAEAAAWSAWLPLDAQGRPQAKDARWIKLKAVLTASEHATPLVKAITIGQTRLDDWKANRDTDGPYALRLSPSPTVDPKTPYRFAVSDEHPVKWGQAVVKINGTDFTSAMKRDGDTVSIEAPAEGWQAGVNTVELTLADSLDNVTNETLVFYIGQPRTTNIVTIRDDGMTLIDGQPFFPLGMACAVKCDHNGNDYDKLFQLFQDAGMNFARHWSGFTFLQKDAAEYIAAAEKHGIKLYMAGGRGANDCDIKLMAENLALQQHLNVVVAWDTGDDTANHIRPWQMRQRYNAIKAVDPWRITTQADPLGPFTRTRYRPYALYSDNFSPEIYPVHNASKEDMDQVVPSVISTMKAIRADWAAVKAPPRNCWPLIQYFYNCGNWNRLQTKEELRCMSYQAIIHGATGVIWYRYAGYRENLKPGFTAEQWETVTSVSKELRRLYDVLITRPAAAQPRVAEILQGPQADVHGNAAVSLLLKDCGDRQVLLAASSVREPVTARLALPKGVLTDFFTGETVPAAADGSCTITFKPLDVRVIVVKN